MPSSDAVSTCGEFDWSTCRATACGYPATQPVSPAAPPPPPAAPHKRFAVLDLTQLGEQGVAHHAAWGAGVAGEWPEGHKAVSAHVGMDK